MMLLNVGASLEPTLFAVNKGTSEKKKKVERIETLMKLNLNLSGKKIRGALLAFMCLQTLVLSPTLPKGHKTKLTFPGQA